MKQIIKKALLTSCIVNLIGFLINIVTYFTMGKMFLCIHYSGGEWGGYDGFGIMMNRIYPLTSSDSIKQGRTWLSFEPIGLLVTLLGVFLIAIFVMSIKFQFLHLWRKNMRYINIKRIILNIGLLLFLFSIIYAGYGIWNNRNAAYTQAIIVFAEPSGNVYLKKSDGTQKMYDTLIVEYIVDNKTYSGNTIALPGEYEIGGEVRYCYNKEKPDEYFYDTLTGNLMQSGVLMVIALMIIFICRSAFKGYRKEYLCRYKKSVIFSVVTGWIPILYYLWFEYIFEPVGLFPGLGEFFFLLFLLIFIFIVNIIVWIIAAVKYSCIQVANEEKE